MSKFILAAVVAAAFSLPATDPFAEVSCTLGDACNPNWTITSGGAGVWVTAFTADKALPQAGGAVYGVVYWNADSFAADQYAQTTVLVSGGSGNVGPAVRFDGSGNGYGFVCAGPTLFKLTATVHASLATGYSACSDNDVVKLEATGTSTTALKVYLNGVQTGSTYNDSTSPWTSGSAGMIGYSSAGAAVLTWTGNNVGGGGPTFPSAIINAPIRCCTPRTVRFGK